jgi:hypothetical protein
MEPHFEPDSWAGEPEKLDGMARSLLTDEGLCERVFATRAEAFGNGYRLGRIDSVAEAEVASAAPSKDLLVELVSQEPWGDVLGAIETVDEGLTLALEATREAFWMWEFDNKGEDRFGDEFSLTALSVSNLDGEWRAAYVARLLRSISAAYGLGTGGGVPIGAPIRGGGSIRELVLRVAALFRFEEAD